MMQFEFLYIHIKSDVYNKNLVCKTKSYSGGGGGQSETLVTLLYFRPSFKPFKEPDRQILISIWIEHVKKILHLHVMNTCSN